VRVRACLLSPVSLVMTGPVDGRQRAVGVGPVGPRPVGDLPHRRRRARASTRGAAAVVSFQQGGPSPREAGGAAPACGPVSPVTVQRACRVPPCAGLDDRPVAVLRECQPIVGGEPPPVPRCRAPGALDDPGARLTGVSGARPSRALQVQPVVPALEDGLADDRAVVMAPARQHRVAQPDQRRLPGGFGVSADRGELGIVTPAGIFARVDERFEAAWRVVPAPRVWAVFEPDPWPPTIVGTMVHISRVSPSRPSSVSGSSRPLNRRRWPSPWRRPPTWSKSGGPWTSWGNSAWSGRPMKPNGPPAMTA
jgi:hypothetical protein